MADRSQPANNLQQCPPLSGSGRPKDHQQSEVAWERQWRGLRLAHEAMMLADAAGVLRRERKSVDNHRDANNPPGSAGTDDDNIHVGDSATTIHQHFAPPAGSTRAASRRTPLSWLMPTLLGAAAATGLGVGGLAFTRAMLPTAPVSPAASAAEPAAAGKVEDVELIVRWKLGADGKWQTAVEPVDPKE
ncbi:MAG: hypothetical protein IT429_25640 [Gemmataceae bacterium]|nr:hypothetical protein [Gemmataceae bacterium]